MGMEKLRAMLNVYSMWKTEPIEAEERDCVIRVMALCMLKFNNLLSQPTSFLDDFSIPSSLPKSQSPIDILSSSLLTSDTDLPLPTDSAPTLPTPPSPTALVPSPSSSPTPSPAPPPRRSDRTKSLPSHLQDYVVTLPPSIQSQSLSPDRSSGSHGGRPCWFRADEWEKCKQRVGRTVEVSGVSRGDPAQGRLRVVADTVQRTLNLCLQGLKDGVTASSGAT
ncbi:hypothetical protein LWI29_007307 [Acer saccharum]|uniref:Uncharacterized protein n=1 Tax=Acer saccharum TaxID=4024 RepID=A0AA39W0Z5_ACESA|nr:hypothetical protein LWI29_007307 [Acer saccharum]